MPVTFGSRPSLACVDTGAALSVMSVSAASLCVAQPSSPRPLLTDASHNLVPSLGIVDTAISLLGRTVHHVFTVINYPGSLILLGHDFGSAHGLGILPRAQTLFFEDDPTLMFSYGASTPLARYFRCSRHRCAPLGTPWPSSGTRRLRRARFHLGHRALFGAAS